MVSLQVAVLRLLHAGRAVYVPPMDVARLSVYEMGMDPAAAVQFKFTSDGVVMDLDSVGTDGSFGRIANSFETGDMPVKLIARTL